jgi:hypothetical protein
MAPAPSGCGAGPPPWTCSGTCPSRSARRAQLPVSGAMKEGGGLRRLLRACFCRLPGSAIFAAQKDEPPRPSAQRRPPRARSSAGPACLRAREAGRDLGVRRLASRRSCAFRGRGAAGTGVHPVARPVSSRTLVLRRGGGLSSTPGTMAARPENRPLQCGLAKRLSVFTCKTLIRTLS